ncbi:TRAP transporter substrate-binding protein DctP [Luminiphilus sp.]|nr:TRAP transporter substrate-binding protein DctP [Luminiphilus sp.]MDA8827896.1 TRAP transporter substrate-binding protein DctP [Luminiphilus sp.]MDA9580633.1 TRAP transporter substrate-binding protein DctP [Luminiphilus sp.]MDB2351773.1 TRAP transporter substrate-binding protein DctP [Luminiphilus sp.]MDB2616557.1 TRAP transporter substrate-binding protein DctP [Luminiphilus sp.]
MFERRFLPVVVIFLVSALVLVVGLWAVDSRDQSRPLPAVDSLSDTPDYRWKLVTTWPKNLPGLGAAPENFARYVNEMSGGRLEVRVFGAGEIVPAFEVFDAVSQGAAEVGHGASYYWKGKIPAAVFFTAVPFGMTAQEMNGWLHYGGGLELWQELYAPFGVIPFAGGSTGVQMAGWFNRELRSAKDLSGLKMRIPGLAGEVFDAAGGTAVRIAGGEVYTSMQTGVIDAVEWVGPYNDRTLGLNEVAEFYYYPGWHEPGAMLEFTVNAAAFTQLPRDLQAIVRYAARAANQDMLDEFTARNNESLQQLLAAGTQLRPLPEDILSLLYEKSVEAMANLRTSDEMAEKIAISYDAFSNNVRAYHEISERAYLNARDKVLPSVMPENFQAEPGR